MSTIRYESAGSRPGSTAGAAPAPMENQIHQQQWPQRYHVVAAVLLLLPAFTLLAGKGVNGVAQLERLAPRIERAPALSVEAREVIGRLVARQSSLAAAGSDSLQARRQSAIARVNGALTAKQSASLGRGIESAAATPH